MTTIKNVYDLINSDSDVLASYAAEFVDILQDPEYTSYRLYDLAGCEMMSVSDGDLSKKNIWPDSGDWVVIDKAFRQGFFGISHDGCGIVKTRVKTSSPAYVDMRKGKKEKRAVDTLTLLERFFDMSGLFDDCIGDRYLFSEFDTYQDALDRYETERAGLTNDPYLATFWVLFFALINRQEKLTEVINIIVELEHRYLLEAVAFSLNLQPTTNVPIVHSSKSAEKKRFLKRRAFLCWHYGTRNKQAGDAKYWYENYIMYPFPDPHLLIRVTDVVNNLSTPSDWVDWYETRASYPENDKCLLQSYIDYCAPHQTELEKRQHANDLFDDLEEYCGIWSHSLETRQLAFNLSHDIHQYVTDKTALLSVTARYVCDLKLTELLYSKYNDICAYAGQNIRQFDVDRTELAGNLCKRFSEEMRQHELNSIDKLHDNFRAHKSSILNAWSAILVDQDVWTIKSLCKQLIKTNSPNRLVLFYSLLHVFETPARGAMLMMVLEEVSFSKKNLDILFQEYPYLIRQENDPNFNFVKYIIHNPISNSEIDKTIEYRFLLNAIHYESVYEWIINVLSKPNSYDFIKVKYVITEHLLKKDPVTQIDSTDLLSRQQVEQLLSTLCELLLMPRGMQRYCPRGELNDLIREQTLSVIGGFANPYAKQWFQSKLGDQSFFDELDQTSISRKEGEDLKQSIVELIENL